MTKLLSSLRNNINIGLLLCSVLLFLSVVKVHTVFGLENPTSKSVGFNAVIPADPPKVPATVAIPQSNQSFTAIPIKVSGICTGDVLVKVFDNGVFVGSAQCQNGAYSLFIDLFNGRNEIVAKIYDALDQQGPDSTTTIIFFNQPGYNSNAPRVILSSDFAKRGTDPGQKLSWPIIVSGGSAPYAVSIDWGDGVTELKSVTAAGAFTVEHTYTSPGLYVVVVKVTDVNGNTAYLQLVAVANGALSQTNQSDTAAPPTVVKFIWWPIVIASSLIIVSFWLGARYMLVRLRKQAEKRIQY